MIETDQDPRFFLHVDTPSDGISSRWHVDFEKMSGKFLVETGDGFALRYDVSRRGHADWWFNLRGPSGRVRERLLRGRSEDSFDAVWPPQTFAVEGEDDWQRFEPFVSRAIEKAYEQFLAEGGQEGDE